jgi:F-type H+-transporting ATPase subunit delta
MENALLLLAQEGRLGLLDEIIAEFEQLITLGGHRPVAHVTTAIALTDKEQLAMREKLAAQFGTDLEFDFAVDPAILGGVVVRVGGKVVDDSVAGKLRALRDTMGLEQR